MTKAKVEFREMEISEDTIIQALTEYMNKGLFVGTLTDDEEIDWVVETTEETDALQTKFAIGIIKYV